MEENIGERGMEADCSGCEMVCTRVACNLLIRFMVFDI